MPWGYLSDSGIMKKWADKYGINVEITRINDYVESINQYTAGGFDGCAMTNMDALSIPAGGGVDSTALIIGDFSNGNDAVILKDKTALADIAGQKVNLVELSVSHYLLARALDTVKLAEKDITVVNTSDADMVAAYGTSDVTSVVTWNPLVSEIVAIPGAHKVFDSSQIPGEIIDMMVVNTETLKDNPALGKALVGAWYEVMGLMTVGHAGRTGGQGGDGQGVRHGSRRFRRATCLDRNVLRRRQGGRRSPRAPNCRRRWISSATSCSDHGILGTNATSVDMVGMSFPDGSTLGDANNVKLRFDPAFMAEAAAGTL